MKKEVKEKLIKYFNEIDMEEAHALSLQDRERFNNALCQKKTMKEIFNILDLQIDGIDL